MLAAAWLPLALASSSEPDAPLTLGDRMEAAALERRRHGETHRVVILTMLADDYAPLHDQMMCSLKRLNLSVASDEGGKKGPVGPAAQRRQIEGFFGVEEAPKKTVRELALEKGVSDKRMNRRLKEVTTHSKCSSQGIALSAVGGGGEASSGARKPIGMSENL